MKIKQMRFMTRREWVAKNFKPNCVRDIYRGGVCGCPKGYGFSDGEHCRDARGIDCILMRCAQCYNKPAVINGKYILVRKGTGKCK